MKRLHLLALSLVASTVAPVSGRASESGPPPPPTTPPSGGWAEDTVTANLRAAFAGAAITPDSLEILSLAPSWACSYHAANPFVLFVGARDVAYGASFVRRSFLLMEAAYDVHAGAVTFPGWTHWLARSPAGLQFDADGEEDITEVVRLEQDGPAIVEFLFQPLGFFDPSDVAVADPSRNTAGYALCTPAQTPPPAGITPPPVPAGATGPETPPPDGQGQGAQPPPPPN